MNDLTATFTFEGDKVFAIHEGKVIASGTKLAEVEQSALEYLDSLKVTRDSEAKEHAKKKATHVITPNGVKGEILGRTPAVWGEQVTARFENGRIATFVIHGEEDIKWVSEKTASTKDPVGRLAKVLEAGYERDRDSLGKRVEELKALSFECRQLIASEESYEKQTELDEIKVAADAEIREIKDVIEHLDAETAEAIEPPKMVAQVVEQADMGRAAGNSWLEVTAQEMIEESENQDFDKLLSEGPELFVTDLDTGALASTGVTREMALSHIVSKTAGFTGEEVEDFREQFLARVEVARRQELAERKQATKKQAKKVAKTEKAHSKAPDDVLFL